MRQKYSNSLRTWLLVLVGSAAGLSLVSLVYFTPSTLRVSGFVLITLVLAKIIPFETPGGTEMTLSSALDITSALVLGPSAPVVCLVADIVAGATAQGNVRKALDQLLDSGEIGHNVVATGAAGLLVARMGFAGLTSVQSLGVALICGGFGMFVRTGLESITKAFRYNVNPVFAAAMVPCRTVMWMVAQVGIGIFGVYAFSLLPLTMVSLAGFVVFALLVLYAARLYIDMRSTYWGTIFALIPAIESEFDYNVGHARRVSAYSLAMARKLVLNEREAVGVYVGGILHDMGMVGVDDQIVNKPDVLSVEEHGQVRRHVEIGAGIVEKVPLLGPAVGAVKHHHERWDGTGYPDGLSGEAIPVGARITAVADVFDALMSKRPHRDAMTVTEALDEIRKGSGTAFDPAIVTALESAVRDELRWGKSVFEQHYSMDFAR